MKLVLNTWLAFQTEGAAEAAALAQELGIYPGLLVEALRGNPLASPYALVKLGRMIEQDYRPDFSINLALKDLELATADAGADAAPIAAAIAARWRVSSRAPPTGSTSARPGWDSATQTADRRRPGG